VSPSDRASPGFALLRVATRKPVKSYKDHRSKPAAFDSEIRRVRTRSADNQL
jgi:hypothetical protein